MDGSHRPRHPGFLAHPQLLADPPPAQGCPLPQPPGRRFNSRSSNPKAANPAAANRCASAFPCSRLASPLDDASLPRAGACFKALNSRPRNPSPPKYHPRRICIHLLAVQIIRINRPSLVATRHLVIHRAGVFNSHLASHWLGIVSAASSFVNPVYLFAGTDPFTLLPLLRLYVTSTGFGQETVCPGHQAELHFVPLVALGKHQDEQIRQAGFEFDEEVNSGTFRKVKLHYDNMRRDQ